MSSDGGCDILIAGFGDALFQALQGLLTGLRWQSLKTLAEVERFVETEKLNPGTLLMVSNHMEDMSAYEVAQIFNSAFDGAKVVFITMERSAYNLEELRKNGFAESLLLPVDHAVAVELIDGCKAAAAERKRKLKAVQLIDISPGETLPFEVRIFLPLNKKYVLATAHGQLSEKKHQMLQSRNASAVYIDHDEMDRFYDFVADKLARLGQADNDAVSETEKQERLKTSVKSLFRSILNVGADGTSFEAGREMWDQTKRVVDCYMKKATGVDLGRKLGQLMGESQSGLDHAQSVSSIACLLSMATGIGKPEDLAFAGLFHDIAVQGSLTEVTLHNRHLLTKEQFDIYAQHPRMVVNYLKEKRMTLTPEVSEIIEKHHERIDGKGFPGQLKEHKIPPSAHLLAYADAFEYLLRPTEGRAPLTPLQIHEEIAKTLGLSFEVLFAVQKFLSSASSASNPSTPALGKKV